MVLAAICSSLLPRSCLETTSRLFFDNGEHFILAKDQVLLVVDLDFRARVLADENAVALLDVQGQLLPFLVDFSLTDGDDLGLHRFLLGRIGDDDSPLAGFLLLESFDEDSVVKRSNLHAVLLNRLLDGARTHSRARDGCYDS